jgi:hypothetical protein
VSGSPAYRGLGDIIVTARPFDEYRAMFALTDDDILAGPILDCPGGAGGFAEGVRAMGGTVYSVDPVYEVPREELLAACRADTLRGNRYVVENPEMYVMGFFRDADDHRERRLAGLEAFAAGFRGPGEFHVPARLPHLPFPDGHVRLALSAHLLFTYPDHLDEADHLAALRELLRVARDEVRVFPLVDTTLTPSPYLDRLRRTLAGEGVGSEIRPVPYEWQRGAHEMLVLRSGRSGDGGGCPDSASGGAPVRWPPPAATGTGSPSPQRLAAARHRGEPAILGGPRRDGVDPSSSGPSG